MMLQVSNPLNQTPVIGQYRLQAIVGAGGMGTVFSAYQPTLKRRVAIKVLPATLAAEPGYIARFNREAELAASLEHSHIVPIYDFGTQRGVSYVVMRLLTGGALADRLNACASGARELPSPGEIASMLDQLSSALDYAHSRGVVHRDIKPGNVLFDERGDVYLTDFGIAHLVNSTHAITSTGIVLGTPSYMAPEQWRDEDVTPATDQYALGVMLYQALTGRVPFEATTPYGLMNKHLNEIPEPPHMARGEVPAALSSVMARAMAKDAADRYPSMRALAEDFRAAATLRPGKATGLFKPVRTVQLPTPVVPPPPLSVEMEADDERRSTSFPWRKLRGVLLFAVLGLALGTGIFTLTQSGRDLTLLALPITATPTGTPSGEPTLKTPTITPTLRLAVPTNTRVPTLIAATAASQTPTRTPTRTAMPTRRSTATYTPSFTWTPVLPTVQPATPLPPTPIPPTNEPPTREPPPTIWFTSTPNVAIVPPPPTETPSQTPATNQTGNLVNTLVPPILRP